ncbi:MAG: Wzz/FepE/Etk N-terminal domain-containing protein [Gammaproteobacteria bacterium]
MAVSAVRQSGEASDYEREVSIAQLAFALWRWRIWLAIAAIVCGASGTIIATILPRKYEATVLVAPVSRREGLGVSVLNSMASQFSGLASLAGLSLSEGSSQRSIAIATLESHSLTEAFIRKNDLVPVLFKSRWDVKEKRWDSPKPPTTWLADRYFAREIRKVSEDRKSGLVSLTITWTDPRVAADWANALIVMTNQKLREQAITQAERAIAYLKGQAENTKVVELQTAIYSLMRTEIEQEMIARGRQEYALQVIDPAIAPQIRSSPITILWALGGALIGLIIVGGVVLIKECS